jgi:hypothetical protein
MQRLFFNLSIIVGPIGLIVLLTNIAVDPANLLRGEAYVEEIAQALVNGNNVDNIANYDERLLQKAYIINTQQPIDWAILGSSRVMEIRQSFFPGEKIANLGVSHANINDLIAITGVLDSCHKLPKKILIGVDPFLIEKRKTLDAEWESLSAYHQYFLKKNNVNAKTKILWLNTLKKYYTLFTFAYFKQSFYTCIKGHDRKIINIGNDLPTISGRLTDGSIFYPKEYTNPDTARVSAFSKLYSKIMLSEVDEEKVQSMDMLINFYVRKQIEVKLIMIPYHYNYFSGINEISKPNFQTYRNLFVSLAHRHGIAIFGSFNPTQEHIKNNEFYDSYHCSGESIQRIIQKHK